MYEFCADWCKLFAGRCTRKCPAITETTCTSDRELHTSCCCSSAPAGYLPKNAPPLALFLHYRLVWCLEHAHRGASVHLCTSTNHANT